MDALDVAFVMFFVSLVAVAVYLVSRAPEAALTAGAARLTLAPPAADPFSTPSAAPQVVDAA